MVLRSLFSSKKVMGPLNQEVCTLKMEPDQKDVSIAIPDFIPGEKHRGILGKVGFVLPFLPVEDKK